MTDNTEKSKRIAKNTLILYIQMFITMAVSLYTSRVILDALGVQDFGIYNLVGGFVAMFGVVRAGLVSATQRFMAYDLGVGDQHELKRTFSTCVFIYAFLALVAVVLAESIGPWFINNKLQIPRERLDAAYWVFQLSVVSLVVSLLSFPYNALIIAHEKMKAFAFISVYEAFMRLFISLYIYVAISDKLIVYAALICLLQISIPLLYYSYCKKCFVESKLIYLFDKQRIKDIYSFTGWSMLGGLANMSITQGLNFVLGLFFNPAVNAARGIAVQVQGAITQFASNFQMAIDPQIIKSYASGDIKYLSTLVFSSSRLSFFLLYIISLPIMLEADYILGIWLIEVPDYTTIFLRLVILVTILDAITNPAVKAIQATGNIKRYQLSVNTVIIATLPVSYFALKLGLPPYSVFIVMVVFDFIAFIIRFHMMNLLIGISFSDILNKIIRPIVLVVALSCAPPILLHSFMNESFLRLILVFSLSTVLIIAASYFCGTQPIEREYLLSKIKSIKNKRNDIQ